MRFDLPGTGNSLDHDVPADAVPCWIDAVVDAAGTLQSNSGATGVVLAGLRLGALLAASAAPRVHDLAGLVLLDPVTSGRAYARELDMTARTLADSTGEDPEKVCSAQGVMIGGLLTTRDTLAGLKKLNLTDVPPVVPTLVLHREGARDIATTMAKWATTTARAEPATGFEDIRANPTFAVTPHATIARTAAWVDRLPKRRVLPHTCSLSSDLTGSNFTETSFVFGPDDRLFGVLCRPGRPAANNPAMIIMNAGRNPHVGWARSSVSLARRLAADGIATLRFDLGGIGDAVDRPGAADHVDELLYHDDQDSELAAAVDFSRSLGLSPTTLLGACSGAYLALRGGVQVSGVRNVVLINLQRFVWRADETVSSALENNFAVTSSYVRRLADLRAWRLLLSGERDVGALLTGLFNRAIKSFTSFAVPAETVKAMALMRALANRKTTVDFIYSEDDPGLVDWPIILGRAARSFITSPMSGFILSPTATTILPRLQHKKVYEVARAAILTPRDRAANLAQEARARRAEPAGVMILTG